MDWKNIREELSRLSEVIDGWDDRKEIGSLERDWALEKLRTLYETIRFADWTDKTESHPVQDDVPVSEPEPPVVEDTADLDLSGMLALETDVEPIPADIPMQVEILEEPVPSIPETRRPERSARPDVERLAVPETEQTVETTLFDSEPEEDDVTRHRRKQRVIMSLYGGDTGTVTRSEAEKVEPEIVVSTSESSGTMERKPFVKPEKAIPVTPRPTPVTPGKQVAPKSEAVKSRRDGAVTFEEITVETVTSDDLVLSSRYSKSEADSVPSGNVLGEVINPNVHTLADTIEPPRNVASTLRRKGTISDLRQAIGINDKFLLIRDLFGGDSDLYDDVMQKLNRFDSLDDCVIYLTENYAWNANSESVRLLMDLLERKFA